jgi:hypothetical protein
VGFNVRESALEKRVDRMFSEIFRMIMTLEVWFFSLFSLNFVCLLSLLIFRRAFTHCGKVFEHHITCI